MKRARARAQGYTIIETLIFLAITGSLFVTVAILITGQQRKTEFNQGVRDLESSMQDISNDIATGYYANTNNFICSDGGVAGVRPVISSSGTNNQGANNGCTFIGKVVQFAPSGSKSTYKIYTVVGKQRVGNQDAQDFNKAMPTVIYPENAGSGIPDASDTNTLAGGVTAEWVRYTNSPATPQQIGSFGFFTSFGKPSTSTGSLSGTQDIQLVPIKNTTNLDNPAAAVTQVNNASNLTLVNPSGGIEVCLQSGGTDQYVIMTIGGNGRSTSVNLTYNSGACPAP
jgi:type II secretory pathway pseudopilin PulG